MGMSDYVRGLREKLGNDFLLVPSAHVAIRDERGRVLLVEELGVVVAVCDIIGVLSAL